MSSLPILDWKQAKKVGEAKVDPKVFNGVVARPLLHEVVWSYGQNRRAFTASTRTRGEVSGGGKKPWRQKGTGRARAASIRAPHWRGGGIVFGPKPKKIRYRLSRGMRLEALRTALNLKIKEGRLVVVDRFDLAEAKTRLLAEAVGRLTAGGRTLAVLEKPDAKVERAGRNLQGFRARTALNLTGEDVARAGTCVFSKEALAAVSQRLGERPAS